MNFKIVVFSFHSAKTIGKVLTKSLFCTEKLLDEEELKGAEFELEKEEKVKV